jgi:ribosome-binding protein aMBF1 (putative translation factor)
MGRASQEFDRQLFNLKLSELSHQMLIRSAVSDRKAAVSQDIKIDLGAIVAVEGPTGRSASRKTGGSFLLNIVDGQLALLRDEWLAGVDRIAREVRQIQGEPVTPDFVREILVPVAMELIGAHESTVMSNVALAAQRTHLEDPHRAQHHLAMEIRKLKGEVALRYEIEARELEYEKAQAAAPLSTQRKMRTVSTGIIPGQFGGLPAGHFPRPHTVTPTEPSNPYFADSWSRPLAEGASWKDFQERFMQLAREEQGREIVITNGKALRRMEVLRAHCNYKDYRERVFVAEEVRSFYEPLGVELTSEDLSKIEAKMLEWTELEKKAGLKAPETGRWTYGTGAVSENFRERVRLCVVEAGRSLPDYLKGTSSEDFWLHRLYLDLLESNSDLLFASSEEGGMILSVCVASATFCSRLERKALEQSEPGRTIGASKPHSADRLRTDGVQAESPHAQNNEKTTRSRQSAPTNAAADVRMRIRQNINKFKKECGWSYDQLADATGIDKKLILSHVHGKHKPNPSTRREYAQAFTKRLEKSITANNLEE